MNKVLVRVNYLPEASVLFSWSLLSVSESRERPFGDIPLNADDDFLIKNERGISVDTLDDWHDSISVACKKTGSW